MAFVHYPFSDLFDAANVAKKTILHKESSINDMIVQLMEFANKARKEGILALQSAMDNVEDEFLIKAMQMAVDGQEPDTLRSMLNTEIEYIEQRHDKGSNIFISLAAYAPAMGMVGTLIGLVQMLGNLNDPSTIGPAMQVALLTTFYGAVLAHMVLLPLASKSERNYHNESVMNSLYMVGVLSIGREENPRRLEIQLNAMLPQHQRITYFD